MNINEHFKNIDEHLYNEQEDIDMTFVEDINDNLASNTTDAEAKISLFTADLVNTAVKKLLTA